jgi:hypothetical protein
MPRRARPLVALSIVVAAACADSPLPGTEPSRGQAASDTASISLSPGRLELYVGYMPEGVVVATASDGSLPILTWTSSDTTVATVVGNGARSATVRARRAGEATVTARTASGRARGETRVVITMPPPMPWPAVPPAAATVGDVTVRAAVAADSAPAGAPAGSVRYTVTATLTNGAAEPRAVRLGDCPLWLTLHSPGYWFGIEGRLLAWDQLGGGRACAATGAAPGETATLAPGASRAVSTSVLTHELFGANPLATGPTPNVGYAFHANLRLDTARVAVHAGAARLSLPADRLDYRAESGTRGAARDTLAARMTLTNRGALPAYLEFGACALRLLAWRTADRSGPPAWDSDRRQPWAGTYGWGCPMYLATRTVAPGADFSPGEFSLAVPLIEMLGDSLPDGRYWFSGQVRVNWAPSPTVDAGALDLALPRGAMPAERAYRYVTYRTTGVTLSGGTVRAAATATLTNAGSALVIFPRDCVVRLVAYRDRARRDAAPRSGAPDWEQSLAGCSDATQEFVLGNGQSRTFETSAAPREILGAGLPAGRYHFALVVRADGRRVFLSAGEADLAR